MMQKAYANLSTWSQKPYGEHLLFWFALAESCVIPVPADPLLLALCTGAPQRSLRFAFICGIGSVLGGVLGYAIGHYAFDSIGSTLLQTYDPHMETFQRVEGIYDRWGFWGVLMAAVTPIPYKVFTLASGVFNFDLGQFILASVIGRNARFFLVGGLMAFGGERIRAWAESSSERLFWVFLVMVLAGGAAVKFL
ncbi:MAG: DedA family protein [Leptolyngbya sp. SIO1D8]|nr:DedA family protein [Leptolyngbya sp. SIO1D8]